MRSSKAFLTQLDKDFCALYNIFDFTKNAREENMKRQHTTVAMAIVLFLAVRIIGAASIKAVSSPFSLPLEILCMLLSAALPACLFIGGQSGARVLPRAPLLHRSHLRYLLLLPVFIVSVSLLATVFTYLAELCGYSFSLQLPKEIPDLFLLAVILPALVEEFFCRHLCFAPFAEQGATSAIWISAILFALLHVNFLQIPYAFLPDFSSAHSRP
jgi:membrane protease YdiL (CAAX protease family)